MAIINQQLETFIVTADQGSFRKAGDALYITPTAVQKQISLLENHLNTKLFLRTHRGLQLTNAGRSLYADGKYILQYANEAEKRLSHVRKNVHNEVRAAFSPLSPLLCLPLIWDYIQKTYNTDTLIIVPKGDDPKTKAETLQSLGTTLDLIETSFDEDKCRETGINSFKIADIPIRIAVPIIHPLASLTEIPLGELQKTTLILPVRGLNKYADTVRNELVERGSFSIIEIEDYTVESYNLCIRENACLLALNPAPVHPLLSLRNVSWDHKIPYGFLYAANPSAIITNFLRMTTLALRNPEYYKKITAGLL